MIYQNNKRTKRIDVRSRIGRIKPNREKTSKSYKKWVQCTYCGEYSLNHNIKRHYTRPDHATAPFGYTAMPKGFHPKRNQW